jgi:hypothetical protein
MTDKKKFDPKKYGKDNTNTRVLFTYACDESMEDKHKEKPVYHHCVYFRGYDERNDILIGHNSFGRKYLPLVHIPNTADRAIEYYEVIVTKI